MNDEYDSFADCLLYQIVKRCTRLRELHLHMQHTHYTRRLPPNFFKNMLQIAPHLRTTLKVLSIQDATLTPYQVYSLTGFNQLQHLDIMNCFDLALALDYKSRAEASANAIMYPNNRDNIESNDNDDTTLLPYANDTAAVETETSIVHSTQAATDDVWEDEYIDEKDEQCHEEKDFVFNIEDSVETRDERNNTYTSVDWVTRNQRETNRSEAPSRNETIESKPYDPAIAELLNVNFGILGRIDIGYGGTPHRRHLLSNYLVNDDIIQLANGVMKAIVGGKGVTYTEYREPPAIKWPKNPEIQKAARRQALTDIANSDPEKIHPNIIKLAKDELDRM